MAGILPGEGLLEVFNWLKDGADKLGSAIAKGAEITGSAIAGVSGLIGNIAERVPSFSLAGDSGPDTSQCVKVGHNAEKAKWALPVDNSGYGCKLEDVAAPLVGTKQATIDVGRNFG